MTKEELEKEAENFIIDRYKLNECYREDNAETREYMRMDVHSQYEEEYQLYLAATKELQEENAELKDCFKIAKDNEYEYQSLFTKAKDHIKKLLDCLKQDTNDPQTNYYVCQYMDKAEQLLNEVEK